MYRVKLVANVHVFIRSIPYRRLNVDGYMISVVQRSEPRNSSDMQENEGSRFRNGYTVVADKFRNGRIAV